MATQTTKPGKGKLVLKSEPATIKVRLASSKEDNGDIIVVKRAKQAPRRIRVVLFTEKEANDILSVVDKVESTYTPTQAL